MSNSYRTMKEEVLVEWKKESGGRLEMPRLIIRKPRKGDLHPLHRSCVERVFEVMPEKYYYGLKHIEMRAREGEVGSPYGIYRPEDKTIILYSLPRSYSFRKLSEKEEARLISYGATVTRGERVEVSWEDHDTLCTWFMLDTFFHEIGHHYRFQYPTRNQLNDSIRAEEILANVHGRRIAAACLKEFRRIEKEDLQAKNQDADIEE